MKVKVIELLNDFESQINKIVHDIEKKNARVVDIRYFGKDKPRTAVIHYVNY